MKFLVIIHSSIKAAKPSVDYHENDNVSTQEGVAGQEDNMTVRQCIVLLLKAISRMCIPSNISVHSHVPLSD